MLTFEQSAANGGSKPTLTNAALSTNVGLPKLSLGKDAVKTKTSNSNVLSQPLLLPCGIALKNRIEKSAISDSLGDGCSAPNDAQVRLY